MNDLTNERILRQTMDVVSANSALTNYEAMVFSLQLLAWAKLSQAGMLSDESGLPERAYNDPTWIPRAWDVLAKQSPILGSAYAHRATPPRIAPSELAAAVALTTRLAETGVLDHFDPSDCLAQVSSGREAGEYSLPAELADVMAGLARMGGSSNVYTPWDYSAQLAARAARGGASVYIESPRETQLPALLSLFIDGNIEVAQGDPIREPTALEGGKLRKFKTCMAFPPIGMRYSPEVCERDWYGRFKDRTNSGTVLAVWHIMAQTQGRAVIAVPHSLLFSPGADRIIREDLLRRGLIEAIVAMPAGLLANANLSFALLVLNMSEQRQTIRFVNADDDRFREPVSRARARLVDIQGIVSRATGALTDKLVAEVSTEAIVANDTMLQVNRYVVPESARRTEQLLASAQTKPLGDVVSILRPMPTTSGEDAISAWEVGAADLPEFAYIPPPSKMVGIESAIAQRNEHQFLRPHDIVLIIKGSVGKVGIVPEDVPAPGAEGWIVGQSGVILRVNDPNIIDPRTLAVYLRSKLGKELLDGVAVRGATIPLIQLRELQRLPIIIPTTEKAAEIGALLDDEDRIQREIEQLRVRQAGLASQVWAMN